MNLNWYNNEAAALEAMRPALRTADGNGISIDRLGYDGVVLLAQFGASGDTLSGSVKAEVEVEHCDDNSSWVDCANADLQNPDTGDAGHVTGTNAGTFAVVDDAADDDKVYAARYVGGKRYVRVVYNVTGTHTNGMGFAALAVLTSKKYT